MFDQLKQRDHTPLNITKQIGNRLMANEELLLGLRRTLLHKDRNGAVRSVRVGEVHYSLVAEVIV